LRLLCAWAGASQPTRAGGRARDPGDWEPLTRGCVRSSLRDGPLALRLERQVALLGADDDLLMGAALDLLAISVSLSPSGAAAAPPAAAAASAGRKRSRDTLESEDAGLAEVLPALRAAAWGPWHPTRVFASVLAAYGHDPSSLLDLLLQPPGPPTIGGGGFLELLCRYLRLRLVDPSVREVELPAEAEQALVSLAGTCASLQQNVAARPFDMAPLLSLLGKCLGGTTRLVLI
jgi:hypothetical protein